MNLLRWLVRGLLGRRLVTTSGTLTIDGPQQAITIRRDGYGIPIIEAANDHDAWFGLGFCHGQDRPLQLELLMRLSRGTLAELVGEPGIVADRLSRRIGFARQSTKQFPILDRGHQAMVEAYAQGINAGVMHGLPKRPHEFALLRADVTAWTPLDVLASFKLQSFMLASNWDMELTRWIILRADGPEALTALEPNYPDWQPVTAPPGALAGVALDQLRDELKQFTDYLGIGGGSNNWVIAGERSASGRPIIANDPHLSPTLPNHWYLAHLRTPAWAVCGATFVGTPSFPAAHNGHAAWGVTAGLIDNTDLFLEQLSADGRAYRQGDAFVPCEVIHETIQVRGAEPVVEEVRITPRGPLLTGIFEGVHDALSIRAVWLDQRPLRGLLDAPKACSFADFRAAFAEWPAMPLNVIYADVTGAIGWQMAGDAPIRSSGPHRLPLPGWLASNDWEAECVPFRAMPSIEKPTAGFIATANNRPEPEGVGPHLGVDFLDGYRLAVIVEALAGDTQWTPERCFGLQMTQRCQPWREMRDVVLRVPDVDGETVVAQAVLREWNGDLAEGSTAATLYQFFIAEMGQRIAKAKAPNSYEFALGRGSHPLSPVNFFAYRRMGQLVRLLREQPPGWFAVGWPAEIAAALSAAHHEWKSLRERRWGHARPLILKHLLLGEKKPWSGVFNLGPLPCGGDDHTPNQAAVIPLAPLEPTNNIAGLRLAIDVGVWSNSRFILAGGQSGNPMSPHYGDMLPIWQRGEGVPIAWTPEEINHATKTTLRIAPQ